ncbi:GNAT family N-acetyltransferase [bacterium]|nr:GNAT family N-acetyltransferase [bacterium]
MTPDGSRVRIRDATTADLSQLLVIEQVCFRTDRLTKRSLARLIRSPSADIFVGCIEDRLVGMCVVLYRKGAKVGRIYSLATLPAARGEGLGGAMLAESERRALRRGLVEIRLEARATDVGVVEFYLRHGYESEGHVAKYYQDGEDALRFRKSLFAPRSPGVEASTAPAEITSR